MSEIIELRSLRDKLTNDAEALHNLAEKENRDLTPEEEGKFEELLSQSHETKRKIAQADRREKLSKEKEELQEYAPRKFTPPNIVQSRSKLMTDDDSKAALRGWMCGMKATKEQRHFADELGIDVGSKELNVDHFIQKSKELIQTRTLETSGTGQYLVPIKLNDQISWARRYFLPILEFCEVFETQGGEPWNWSMIDDTLAWQNVVMPSQGSYPSNDVSGSTGYVSGIDPVIQNAYNGTVVQTVGAFGAEVFSSGTVTATVEQIQDSQQDVVGNIGKALSIRLARQQEQRSVNGSGTGSPVQSVGLTTCATATLNLGSANQITYDYMVQLENTLDQATLEMPGMAVIMNQKTLGQMRRIVDLIGRPLWDFSKPFSAEVGRAPKMFMLFDKYPILISNQMADITSNSLGTNVPVVIMGNLLDFKYRKVKNSLVFTRFEEYYMPTIRSKGFYLEERGYFNLAYPQANYPTLVSLNSFN